MDWRLLYIVPLLIAIVIAAALALFAWQRRATAGARCFAIAMGAVAVWSIADVATLLSQTAATQLFWTNVQYVGIALVPLGWFCFSMSYTGHGDCLAERRFAWLWIHPIVIQLVVWTNPLHRLYRTTTWLDTGGPVPMLRTVAGPAFWVHTIYAYVLLLTGAYLLVRAHLREPRLYRRQTAYVLVAVLAPWLADVVTLLNLNPLHGIDLTPFAFTISGLVIAWSLLRYRLLDLLPVAHDAVMEGLSSGIVVLDRQDRIVDINPAAVDLLVPTHPGDRRAGLLGRPIGEVWPPSAELEYPDLLSHCTGTEDVCETTMAMDSTRICRMRISPLHQRKVPPGREETIGHLVAIEDITDYTHSQIVLRQYTERLHILHEIDRAILAAQSPETIAAAALDQIHHVLPAKRVSVVLDAAGDLEGIGNPQLLACRTHPPLTSRGGVWQKVLNAGTRWVSEPRCVNRLSKDGSDELLHYLYAEGVRAYLVVPLIVQDALLGTLNLEATVEDAFTAEHIDVATQIASSLAVALQNARLYAAAKQELTERKLAEAALRASEASLREKADDLAARNAELDAFAHTVAHDLKAPLALLIGYTTFLDAIEPMDETSLTWCLQSIEESARKMGQIIDELLLLASVRKRDEIDLAPLDMGVIVGDVLARLTDTVDRRAAKIDVPDTWPVARGYAPWIEEVWANYISNAIKYGGSPPEITVGATPINGHGDPHSIRFWVRDNGNGLTPTQQARLFVPFERLDQQRIKGYGLGLSIVQRIMHKLGGAVGVESTGQPGEGSLFYFTLPAANP